MKKTYDIKSFSVDDIVKKSLQDLKESKSKRSKSGAWICYCYVYSDKKKIGNSATDNIKKKIEEAYILATLHVDVDIDCKPEPEEELAPY